MLVVLAFGVRWIGACRIESTSLVNRSGSGRYLSQALSACGTRAAMKPGPHLAVGVLPLDGLVKRGGRPGRWARAGGAVGRARRGPLGRARPLRLRRHAGGRPGGRLAGADPLVDHLPDLLV